MSAAIRALWAFTAALLFGGGMMLEMKYERSIDVAKAEMELLYRHTIVNERIVAHAAEWRAAQSAAETDVRRLSANASLSAATAALLSTLQDAALRQHAQIRGLEAGRTIAENRLLATDLTLHVRGRFRNLVRFVEDMSGDDVLIKVRSTDLVLSSQRAVARQPDLDATVHAVLYRVQNAGERGETRVASTP